MNTFKDKTSMTLYFAFPVFWIFRPNHYFV